MLLNFVEAGKWGLSSSNPDVAELLYFWFDLVLIKIEYYRTSQVHSGAVE